MPNKNAPSAIWSGQADTPLVQDAAYSGVTKGDRAYIDSQILGTQQLVLKGVITTTTSSFTQPAVNANVTVALSSTVSLVQGLPVYVAGGGVYTVISVGGPTSAVLQNTGASGNASPGATINANSKVVGSGVPGAAGVAGSLGAMKRDAIADGSNNVTVQGFNTQPLTLTTPATIEGQAWLWDVASGTYKLGVPAGGVITPVFFSALSTLTPSASRQSQNIDGYSAVGDGGQGRFDWNSTSTATPDLGTVVAVTGISTGRWIRHCGDSPHLHFGWFGGSPQNSDNLAAWNRMIAAKDIIAASRLAASTAQFNVTTRLYAPGGAGRYRMSASASFGQYPCVVEGDGCYTNNGANFGHSYWAFPSETSSPAGIIPISVPGDDLWGTVFYFYNQTDGFTFNTLYQPIFLKHFGIVGSTANLYVPAGQSFTIPAVGSNVTIGVRWNDGQPSPVLPSFSVGQDIYIAGLTVAGITGGAHFKFQAISDAGGGFANFTVQNTSASYNLPPGTAITTGSGGALGISTSQITRGLQSNCASANSIYGHDIRIFNFFEGYQPGATEGANFRDIVCVGNDINISLTGVSAGWPIGGVGATGVGQLRFQVATNFTVPAVNSTQTITVNDVQDPIFNVYSPQSPTAGQYVTIGTLEAHNWYEIMTVGNVGHVWTLTVKNIGILGQIAPGGTQLAGTWLNGGPIGTTDNQFDYVTLNSSRIALYALTYQGCKISGGSWQGNGLSVYFATTPGQSGTNLLLEDFHWEGNGVVFNGGPEVTFDCSYGNMSNVIFRGVQSACTTFNSSIAPFTNSAVSFAGSTAGGMIFEHPSVVGAVTVPTFGESWRFEVETVSTITDNGGGTVYDGVSTNGIVGTNAITSGNGTCFRAQSIVVGSNSIIAGNGINTKFGRNQNNGGTTYIGDAVLNVFAEKTHFGWVNQRNGVEGILAFYNRSTTYTGGQVGAVWCIPSVDNGHIYVLHTAGTTGAADPAWTTGAGSLVSDGTGTVWQEAGASTYWLPFGRLDYHGNNLGSTSTGAGYAAVNVQSGATYTVRNDPGQYDTQVACNTTSNAMTVTLPADFWLKDGDTYWVYDYKGNAATNSITIVPGAGTVGPHINGVGSWIVSDPFGGVLLQLIANSTWIVIASTKGGGGVATVASNGVGSVTLANGANDNIHLTNEVMRFSGPTGAYSIGGFTGPGGVAPYKGQKLTAEFDAAQAVTITQNSGSDTYPILLSGAASITATPAASGWLTYRFYFDGTNWRQA